MENKLVGLLIVGFLLVLFLAQPILATSTPIPTDSTPIISKLPNLLKPSGPTLDVEVVTKIRAVVSGLTAYVDIKYIGKEKNSIYLNYFEVIFIDGSPSRYSPGEVIYHEDLNKTLRGSQIWRVPIARVQGNFIQKKGMDWYSERHELIKYKIPLFEMFSTQQGTINYTLDNVTKTLTITEPPPDVPTGSTRTIRFVISYTKMKGEDKDNGGKEMFVTEDKTWVKEKTRPLMGYDIPEDYHVLLGIALNNSTVADWARIYDPDKVSFRYGGQYTFTSPNGSIETSPGVYSVLFYNTEAQEACKANIEDENMIIDVIYIYNVLTGEHNLTTEQ